MLTLYGGPLTRAFIVEWYLKELAVPYQFVSLAMNKGEHLTPEFLEINPMGRLPAIEDGGFKLWESGAILGYLAEKYDQLPPSLEERAMVHQWVHFANATLIPGLFGSANVAQEYPRLFQPLDDRLQRYPFLMGFQLSIADISVGAVLAYIPILLGLDLSAYPPDVAASIRQLSVVDFQPYLGLQAYLERLRLRPAFRDAIGDRNYATSHS